MAVTLSIIELLDAIRVGHSDAEMAQGRRLRDYATTAVLRYAPSAPDIVHDEAAILIAGYLFDKPTAQGGGDFLKSRRWEYEMAMVKTRAAGRNIILYG